MIAPMTTDADTEEGVPDDIVLTALLRFARRTYGNAIRQAQAEVGCGDIPRNGTWVIGALSRTSLPLSVIIAQLGVSKQAAGQLVDTLVLRGYLDRSVDPQDRRRMNIELTERGRSAAAAGKAATEAVDAELKKRVGAEYVDHCRVTLAALIDIGEEAELHAEAERQFR
jgi:DNA-binding MarR family transcriptional regulator